MKLRSFVTLGCAIAAFAFAPESSLAQKRPVQISLVTPVQIFPPEDTIAGLRINILYGRNVAITGLDIGIVNHSTGISRGLQYGLVGVVEDFQGWQSHAVNVANGKFEGFQSGWVNVSEIFRGFQYGLVNYANDTEGFQLSLVNYAQTLKGLQIGLVNIIREDGLFPVFPIFNVGKKK